MVRMMVGNEAKEGELIVIMLSITMKSKNSTKYRRVCKSERQTYFAYAYYPTHCPVLALS